MKKLFLFLPLLAVPFLNGCNETSRPTQLTFGTLKDNEAIQLSSSEFTTHMENNENFLLAIYPRDSTCSCWRTFSEVINDTVKNENLLIYKYCAQDVADNKLMKEIGGFNDRLDAPTFYIIKEKSIARYYNFSTSANFFKDRTEFVGELSNHIKRPKMFYISKDQLDSKVTNKETFSVFYARNACSDCNYVIPHTLTPYFDNTANKKDLYIFDLQPWYPTSEEGKAAYQLLKDQLGLSVAGNETYGFNNGVVPAFYYYEAGNVIDACVYANDGALTARGDGSYQSLDTYYTEERLTHLHYLDNVGIKDITTVSIPSEETVVYENSHYWDISFSSSYYDSFLVEFLNTYL